MAAERLQKILAAAGIASRRKAEELIAEGHVSVNGNVVTELGTKADSRMDEIRVDGQIIGRPERHVYFILYKPKGCVTTLSDPEGRPTITDLIKGIRERVFPVGRLDYMSEGLLLLTNDGELMAQLTHAKTHVPKTYMVKVSGHPTDEQIDRLRAGITLPPEPGLAGARGKKQPGVERRSFAVKTAPAEIDLVREQENPWYQVTLIEGRNRQIRRMFEEIGFHIEKIKRIRYGTLELNVEPGELRQLTFGEINDLRKSIAKPYRIQPPRPKEDTRRPRTSKAAQRGFPKPERPGRGGRPQARPAAARPAAPAEGGASEFRERPQRADTRPPRREAAEGARPSFERKEFAPRERKEFAARKDFGDRKPGFGPGKPAKRFAPRDDQRGAREFRGPEGRSSRPASDARGDRPRTGARPPRPAGGDFRERAPRSGSRDARPPRREFSDSRSNTSPRKTFDRKPGFGPGKPPKRFDREDSFESRPPRGDRPPREGGFRGPDTRGRGPASGSRGPRSSAGPGGRSSGPRSNAPRNSGPRGGGTRPGGPRPGGKRPGGPRGGGKGPRPGFRRD